MVIQASILMALIVSASITSGVTETQSCAYKQGNVVGWTPPAQGIVTNGRQAVKIAQIAWSSINPQAKSISEADWEKTMKAALAGHIWTVSRSHPADTIGGDLIISISQCDGRVLDVLLTQ